MPAKWSTVPLVLLALVMADRAFCTPREAAFELIVLHNSDMHARFEQTGAYGEECKPSDVANNRCYGGFARVAHKVREYRRAELFGGLPVLYLNAGDTYTGTAWFTVYQNTIAAAFLNRLQPDAISLGNHEFDLGVDGLVPFLNEVKFPVVVANLNLSNTPTMRNISALRRSTVFTKAGVRVGVIGYLTPETKQITPASTVAFTDEIKAINIEAAALKAQGVNILIALGHSGLERDRAIAAGCPEVDVVIGGHSHTFLYSGTVPDVDVPAGPYPVMVTNAVGKQVPVAHAYAYTKYLGCLHLQFDADGNLMTVNGNPILLNGSVHREADVLRLLQRFRPGVMQLGYQIGHTNVHLDASRCRFEECNIGNMLADSLVAVNADNYKKSDDGDWTNAAIGFIQGGSIRASLSVGAISRKDIKTVLPFGNIVAVTELNGTQLRQILEHSVHRYDGVTGYGEFLQMAGVHVVYDLSRPPLERVVDVEVRCAQCKVPRYAPLKDDASYRVIVSQFLYQGGDGFTMFADSDHEQLLYGEYEIAEQYLKHYSPIYPAIENRIRFECQLDSGPPNSTTVELSDYDRNIANLAFVFLGMIIMATLLESIRYFFMITLPPVG
ncbi:protein 5NUC-like [Anopheles ziemanni]|uniref:protein 5NUC-like n=1 Tax=Anopheles coustani TaxID=139045 RepID=UPI002658647E|nr:protein 5NUC-like [Anopheles coustani]XP_058176291.1 protein 5NUC-like [Anopheles ziemanni]